MKPLFANVLVKRDTREEVSGTYEGVQKDIEITTGTVVSVGAGHKDWPVMVCKAGDRIKWHRNSGSEVIVDGVKHVILNEEKREIIGKL